MAPLQPPVKGNGIATKVAKPTAPYFSILELCFFLVFSKSQTKNLLKNADFLDNQLETGSKNKRMKMTGIKFPITETKKAIAQFRW